MEKLNLLNYSAKRNRIPKRNIAYAVFFYSLFIVAILTDNKTRTKDDFILFILVTNAIALSFSLIAIYSKVAPKKIWLYYHGLILIAKEILKESQDNSIKTCASEIFRSIIYKYDKSFFDKESNNIYYPHKISYAQEFSWGILKYATETQILKVASELKDFDLTQLKKDRSEMLIFQKKVEEREEKAYLRSEKIAKLNNTSSDEIILGEYRNFLEKENERFNIEKAKKDKRDSYLWDKTIQFALEKCPYCYKPISKLARKCPHCTADL